MEAAVGPLAEPPVPLVDVDEEQDAGLVDGRALKAVAALGAPHDRLLLGGRGGWAGGAGRATDSSPPAPALRGGSPTPPTRPSRRGRSCRLKYPCTPKNIVMSGKKERKRESENDLDFDLEAWLEEAERADEEWQAGAGAGQGGSGGLDFDFEEWLEGAERADEEPKRRHRRRPAQQAPRLQPRQEYAGAEGLLARFTPFRAKIYNYIVAAFLIIIIADIIMRNAGVFFSPPHSPAPAAANPLKPVLENLTVILLFATGITMVTGGLLIAAGNLVNSMFTSGQRYWDGSMGLGQDMIAQGTEMLVNSMLMLAFIEVEIKPDIAAIASVSRIEDLNPTSLGPVAHLAIELFQFLLRH